MPEDDLGVAEEGGGLPDCLIPDRGIRVSEGSFGAWGRAATEGRRESSLRFCLRGTVPCSDVMLSVHFVTMTS